MVPFSVAPKIALYQEFVYFAKEFELGKEDLLITNEFIYEAGMDKLNLECSIIFLFIFVHFILFIESIVLKAR